MKLKTYKQLFKQLIDNISEGVHIIDSEGKSIVYNHRMADLEMLEGKDVLGRQFEEVFGNIKDSTLQKSLRENIEIRNEKQTYINKYGKTVTTINTTIPIEEDGKIVVAMEIAQNLTQIKEMTDTILELQKDIIKPTESKIKRIKEYRFNNIAVGSESFQKTIDLAKRAAKTSASVFIFGETGTGKELIAQSIHFDGTRKDMPFIAQNCAAIPDSLLEGLLFGTAKGGFTGAVDREGLFEQANGGTLLLDEINSMPYETQAKLLRVLQEGYVRRVGGTRDVPVDVRIIATSNEPPEKILELGKMRKDLFYRINIIPITIPPLRDRKSDILLLTDRFIKKYNEKFDKDIWMISEKGKAKLLDHDFPGNVRELENIIMGAMSILDDEHVISDNLINIVKDPKKSFEKIDLIEDVKVDGLENVLKKIEAEIIERTFEKNNNNVTKTAEELGMKRQTLQHKLKKLVSDSISAK